MSLNDDVVCTEPAMDGDGFLDGNPARCQSCGLPGQVVVDDEGASFSADDREWEIQKEVERAEKAESRQAEAVALLREARRYIAEHTSPTAFEAMHGGIVQRIDAHLAACDGKGVGDER